MTKIIRKEVCRHQMKKAVFIGYFIGMAFTIFLFVFLSIFYGEFYPELQQLSEPKMVTDFYNPSDFCEAKGFQGGWLGCAGDMGIQCFSQFGEGMTQYKCFPIKGVVL